MTCEDFEDEETANEHVQDGLLSKAARGIVALVASPLVRRCVRVVPHDLRMALSTILLTLANVLSSHPSKW